MRVITILILRYSSGEEQAFQINMYSRGSRDSRDSRHSRGWLAQWGFGKCRLNTTCTALKGVETVQSTVDPARVWKYLPSKEKETFGQGQLPWQL